MVASRLCNRTLLAAFGGILVLLLLNTGCLLLHCRIEMKIKQLAQGSDRGCLCL
jgi:hypothetical protein